MPNDTLRQDSETPYIPARKGPAVKRPIRLPRSEEPVMLFDVAFSGCVTIRRYHHTIEVFCVR